MTIAEIKTEFIKRFGGDLEDIRIFKAPGRVNLIGEHVDYNGGHVFPAAISLETTLAARKRSDSKIIMQATDLDVNVVADLKNINDYRDLEWGNYQMGVASELMSDGMNLYGCELLYDDTVPHGGGLSSSAAIEVATALCFTTFSNEKMGKTEVIDMVKIALIGQRAENNYVGVSCGIMDQFASAMGKKDHAIFLDSKDLSFEHIPLNLYGRKIVITNTNKKRSLITSKYNERRKECEKALAILKTGLSTIKYLADVTVQQFENNKNLIKDETVRKRAEHVIYECDRVLKSKDVLIKGDIKEFGILMNASHDSLRDLYEVTGDELDVLVCAARKVKGCLGSRMTGAGFGGCTVSIVEDEKIEEFCKTVEAEYIKKIGYSPSFYITEVGDGGREIK